MWSLLVFVGDVAALVLACFTAIFVGIYSVLWAIGHAWRSWRYGRLAQHGRVGPRSIARTSGLVWRWRPRWLRSLTSRARTLLLDAADALTSTPAQVQGLVDDGMRLHAVTAAIQLGLFEALRSLGPSTAAEIATAAGMDARNAEGVFRLLRYLASASLLDFYESPGLFAVNDRSALLLHQQPSLFASDAAHETSRTDKSSADAMPISLAGALHVYSDPRDQLSGWLHLADAIRDNVSGIAAGRGQEDRFVDVWQLYGAEPELYRRFLRARSSTARLFSLSAVTGAVSWSAFKSVVDVAGGDGTFLRSIVASNRALADAAIVLERPEVVALFADASMNNRPSSASVNRRTPSGGSTAVINGLSVSTHQNGGNAHGASTSGGGTASPRYVSPAVSPSRPLSIPTRTSSSSLSSRAQSPPQLGGDVPASALLPRVESFTGLTTTADHARPRSRTSSSDPSVSPKLPSLSSSSSGLVAAASVVVPRPLTRPLRRRRGRDAKAPSVDVVASDGIEEDDDDSEDAFDDEHAPHAGATASPRSPRSPTVSRPGTPTTAPPTSLSSSASAALLSAVRLPPLPQATTGEPIPASDGSGIHFLAGDMFQAFPASARGKDLYILHRVLSTCDDDDAVRVLQRTREAMGPASQLVIIDALVAQDEGDLDHARHCFDDIALLAMSAGKERAAEQFARILGRAGLKAASLVRTVTSLTLIFASPL